MLLQLSDEKAGRAPEALEVIRPALATIMEPGVGVFASELYRLQGICLLRCGADAELAIDSLRTAVAVSKQQGATVLELRASASLAQAAIDIGRPHEGVNPLRDVCSEFPDGFKGKELSIAREILAGAA